MSKKLYNLVLQPGTDEAAFISNEAAGMDVHDNLNLFDMLLCMMLTEEEAATLKASEKVFEIEAERQVIETYPTTTPDTNLLVLLLEQEHIRQRLVMVKIILE